MTHTPTITSSPPLIIAEGTLARAAVSRCGLPYYLIESGVDLTSRSIDLARFIGDYVRVWGWEMERLNCEPYALEVRAVEQASPSTRTPTPTCTTYEAQGP